MARLVAKFDLCREKQKNENNKNKYYLRANPENAFKKPFGSSKFTRDTKGHFQN